MHRRTSIFVSFLAFFSFLGIMLSQCSLDEKGNPPKYAELEDRPDEDSIAPDINSPGLRIEIGEAYTEVATQVLGDVVTIYFNDCHYDNKHGDLYCSIKLGVKKGWLVQSMNILSPPVIVLNKHWQRQPVLQILLKSGKVDNRQKFVWTDLCGDYVEGECTKFVYTDDVVIDIVQE